jgi:hypothetical protein
VVQEEEVVTHFDHLVSSHLNLVDYLDWHYSVGQSLQIKRNYCKTVSLSTPVTILK